MRISYEVTEDDFWAFQDHFMRHSQIIRQMYRRYALWGALPVGFLAYLPFQRHGVIGGLISSAFISLIWVVGMLTAHKRGARSNRRYMGGVYRKLIEGVMGESDLEIVPQGLRGTSHRGEGIIYWDAIGEVATTPTHTFIYMGKAQAIIIPQRRILSGNYHTFMQAFADVYARRGEAALQSAAIPAPVVTATEATEAATESEVQTVGRTNAH